MYLCAKSTRLNWLDINSSFANTLGYSLSYIEFVGALAGLLCVWLAAKSNIWTWPVGLINVACFFAIFYQIQLYSDMFLQVYFFVTSIYGWIIWARQNQQRKLPITYIHNRQRIILGFIIIIATLLTGTFIKNIHVLFPTIFKEPASYAYLDTFVAILSVVATLFDGAAKNRKLGAMDCSGCH